MAAHDDGATGNRDADDVLRTMVGLDSLGAYVSAFMPEWAYAETGIEPQQIRDTARTMAAAAPATVLHPGRHSAW